MDISDKINYWFGRHFTVLVVGLFITFGIIGLFNGGYNWLLTILLCFTFGVALFYRRMMEQNKADCNMAVIIIGCDSGLGYSLALDCRAVGFAVIASVLNRDGPNVEELSQRGIYVSELDISNKESIKNFGYHLREFLTKESLGLYALVNNAGLMVIGNFEWQTDEHMMQQINVNFTGTMRITKEVMPLLRTHKGRIILISSHCALEPLPGFAIYGATKSAIRAWATSIRVELSKQDIKVTCFAPGSFFLQSNIMSRQMDYFKEMKTSMSTEVWNNYNFDKTVQHFETLISRIRPQRVSNSVIYKTFQDSLLDKYPSELYKCCPWRYTYYNALCKITPTCIRDMLIQKFIQIPQ